MWGLLTRISGQPGSFDPNFRFFRVKALKGFKISGFLGQGLDNLTIFGSGWVEPTFENLNICPERLGKVQEIAKNEKGLGGIQTMIYPGFSCPGSFLKTTLLPLGYPWVSGGRYVAPEPRFRGLVLYHQLLKVPEPKNRSKRA